MSQYRPHPHAYEWHDGNTSHHQALIKDETQRPHPHMDAPPVNDQAAGVGVSTYAQFAKPYGTLTPGRKSDLSFYDYHGKLPKVKNLVAQHGFQTYYAGGSHGRPDLANKNYNTKHLMVYDPTPASGGDFGDRDYTDAWRQTHELAHALTLPELNSQYGEGRRIGKLGQHRTIHEAKRAVHWEWLAAHKQRELNKQLGIHVPDEAFNKEINTVIHDALHRAVTGKFTEPSDEGFYPHSHKVPLEHALKTVENAGNNLGLKGEHDLLNRKSEVTSTQHTLSDLSVAVLTLLKKKEAQQIALFEQMRKADVCLVCNEGNCGCYENLSKGIFDFLKPKDGTAPKPAPDTSYANPRASEIPGRAKRSPGKVSPLDPTIREGMASKVPARSALVPNFNFPEGKTAYKGLPGSHLTSKSSFAHSNAQLPVNTAERGHMKIGNEWFAAHRHGNGGGWIADTAHVHPSAYVHAGATVGPKAVLGEKAVAPAGTHIFGRLHTSVWYGPTGGANSFSGDLIEPHKAGATGSNFEPGGTKGIMATDGKKMFTSAQAGGATEIGARPTAPGAKPAKPNLPRKSLMARLLGKSEENGVYHFVPAEVLPDDLLSKADGVPMAPRAPAGSPKVGGMVKMGEVDFTPADAHAAPNAGSTSTEMQPMSKSRIPGRMKKAMRAIPPKKIAEDMGVCVRCGKPKHDGHC